MTTSRRPDDAAGRDWGLEPTRRFTGREGDYVRFRPSYPADAIDRVVEGLAKGGVCADVGAGTGISARLLAERGMRVLAIEPNRAMREAAGDDPRIEWREGTGEATGLAESSVDLVLCAQSFHWFDRPAAIREFARVLRPGARLALLWNSKNLADAFSGAYWSAVRKAGEDPREEYPFEPEVITREGLFGEPEYWEGVNEQRLDLGGVLGRAQSASYTPTSGEGYETMVRELAEAVRAHADASGEVVLRYRVKLWRATKRA